MSIKSIIKDQDFWMLLIVEISLLADAASEGKWTLFRIMSILVVLGLLISFVIKKFKLQREKNLPFLVVVGKSDSRYRVTRNQVEEVFPKYKIHINELKKEYGLHSDDWIFYQESILKPDSDNWQRIIERIENKFWRLAERVPDHKLYHVFLNGPAALALGMGATIGARNETVFYHYTQGAGNIAYSNKIDFREGYKSTGIHVLKERVKHYKMISTSGLNEVYELKQDIEVLCAINIAGHSPVGDVMKRSKENGFPVVTIDSKTPGNVSLDADWIKLSQEISSVLLNIAGMSHVKRLHLFISAPLPIAFCIGSALGKFVRATIYNYFADLGDYKEAFSLDSL